MNGRDRYKYDKQRAEPLRFALNRFPRISLSLSCFGMAEVVASGKRVCGMPEKAQLHVAMLALQFGYAGFHVVSRVALNMGISKLVFPVYRNVVAFVLLLPFAYFFEKYALCLA